MRKIRRSSGKLPILRTHENSFLNFKKIKKISLKELSERTNFKWQTSAYEFFKDLDPNSAGLRSNYELDALDYFFMKTNKTQPLIYRVESTRYQKSFITDFLEIINPPITSFRMNESYGEANMQISEFTLVIEKDLILNFDSDDLNFLVDPSKYLEESESNPFYLIMMALMSYKKASEEKNKINVVYRGDYGFDKESFSVKKIKLNIEDNYNDDFKEVSDFIIHNLNDKKKTGLYILNGNPGTGKTTWIRYLASKIRRNIIFISPDMVDQITDPSFIPFLMNNSDSILIIEDAEPALQKREGNVRTSAISNILNLTDGLLSDCLNISIVATFNTNTKELDSALLRHGRLVKSYTFDKLEVNKSNVLLKKLGHDHETKEPMTLADIYFFGTDNKGNTKFTKPQNTVGFNRK